MKRLAGTLPPFKRVIIETTGLADPAPILHTLMSDQLVTNYFRLDGVITTVDAANGADTLDKQFLKQAEAEGLGVIVQLQILLLLLLA